LKDQDVITRDALLRLASHQHPAVLKALGSHFPDFALLDSRLPRALVRIVMASSVRPYRGDSDLENRANQQAYREKIEASIAAEQQWLDGTESDPAWPELPAWLSRPRRGIRIGDWANEDDDELNEEQPAHYVDEHALGALVGYLIRLTVGELPPRVIALAAHLMRWTDEANGPHGEEDRDRDNRPDTWNSHFCDFPGILCVALPHEDVVAMFLEPITRFKDEAFHDAIAEFLRGFDRAMQAIDTRKPENPAAVRALLAGRIRHGWNFERLADEKGFTSETHAGDALNAMFYQPHRLANRGRPSIPDNWDGLDATMPTLITLVTGARMARPHIITDPTSVGMRPEVAENLMKSLDVLIRSGVTKAREIEERVAASFGTAPRIEERTATSVVDSQVSHIGPQRSCSARDRKFVDSPLEENGFEPSVPRDLGSGSRATRLAAGLPDRRREWSARALTGIR
jgi:hypothetical protein